MKRIVLAVFCSLFLVGCSNFSSYLPGSGTSITPVPVIPPKEEKKEGIPEKLVPPKGKAFLTLRGQGVQVFRCRSDDQGPYYRFEQPNAKLFDSSGEQVAELSGPMSAFTHRDGSTIISAKVIAWAEPKDSSKDLLLVLMQAYSEPGTGTFNNVSYIQRLNPKGGIPSSTCTANQQGRLLEVPYSADYIFWK